MAAWRLGGSPLFVWRLARATALAVSLASVAACSLVLDWNGYTGGGDATGAGDGIATPDAGPDTGETKDATGEHDSTETGDGSRDSAPSAESAPPCTPQTCGGCCDSTGFCAGGQSAATCGTGGHACQNCTSQGLACRSGSCSSVAAQDAGPPPACTPGSCSGKGVCVPVWMSGCCKSDGTCGCQYVIPQPPGPCI